MAHFHPSLSCVKKSIAWFCVNSILRFCALSHVTSVSTLKCSSNPRILSRRRSNRQAIVQSQAYIFHTEPWHPSYTCALPEFFIRLFVRFSRKLDGSIRYLAEPGVIGSSLGWRIAAFSTLLLCHHSPVVRSVATCDVSVCVCTQYFYINSLLLLLLFHLNYTGYDFKSNPIISEVSLALERSAHVLSIPLHPCIVPRLNMATQNSCEPCFISWISNAASCTCSLF